MEATIQSSDDESFSNEAERCEAEEIVHNIESGLTEEKEELQVEYTKHNLTPQNTIVVFDLHHVLMRPQYKKMAKRVLNHPNKRELVSVVSSPRVLRSFVNRIGNETPEKSMKDMEEQFKETKYSNGLRNSFSPLIVDICNCQKPDYPTFEVIRKKIVFKNKNHYNIYFLLLFLERIKDSGYGIYLLSNIGIEYFLDLRTKMPNELFEHFDGFYTTNPDDDYVNKPNIKIFKR